MEVKHRSRLDHSIPSWVPDGSFYFVTINCKNRGANTLCVPPLAQIVLDAAAFYHQHLKWHCRLMLLMPDHLHGVISVPAQVGLIKVISDWKRYLSRNEAIE